MTNEELVNNIKAGINTADNMLQLWQQCRKFIHIIAIRYEGRAELEDLEQEGYLALYAAVDGFNPAAGYKFLTYAKHWINQYMLRYIQNSGTVRIPVHEHEKLLEYRKVVNAFKVYRGRKPSRHEIALNMGISDKKMVASLERAAKMGKIGSLDSYYVAGNEDSGTLGDMIAGDVDIEGDVLDEVQQEQLKAVLWPLVDALPGNQGIVLRQRFQKNRTLKETGESIGITVEQVRQIEYKAMRGLRCSRNARVLRPFLMDEDIYSRGLIGNGVGRFNRTWTSSTERAAMYGITGHFLPS